MPGPAISRAKPPFAPLNAWSTSQTGASGKSATIDTFDRKDCSAFGNTSGASTLTWEVSQDGSTFYATSTTIAANGAFHGSLTTSARYVRLSSGSDVVANTTISAK